jgi:hypothetical protein
LYENIGRNDDDNGKDGNDGDVDDDVPQHFKNPNPFYHNIVVLFTNIYQERNKKHVSQ